MIQYHIWSMHEQERERNFKIITWYENRITQFTSIMMNLKEMGHNTEEKDKLSEYEIYANFAYMQLSYSTVCKERMMHRDSPSSQARYRR